MAELALAIIPLGVTVTSGLVKYLKTFNDHDDDRARLVRQAERFETTSNPELSISASEASACLRECQKALEELDNLQQKTFATITSTVATTPHARTKGKIKDGYKKLLYPLRKSDIEALEGALEKLSTTLSLALGILHLKILNEQMVEIQKNTIVNSNTSTAIKELHQPISRIDLAAPVLQTSVDAIVPHFDQRFDQISYQISYQHVQMQAQIKSLLDMAGLARYQDHLGTNQQPSYNHSGEQGNYIAARETEQELPFLVMGLPLDAIKLKNINETRSRVILNATQRKLHELFCSERASPNDVTQDSSTLLHLLGFTAYHWLTTLQGANSPFVRLTCEALVNFLVAAGTSVTVRDRYGVLALHTVIDGTFVPASIYGQLNAENDVEERSTLYFSPQFDRRALLDYYDHNQSVASIQYGPLSLAVIRNNLQEVERLLSLYAHMLKELRSRRRQLRDLVRNKLSITEFSKFTPLEEVPDIDAIAMDRLLRQKGILGLGPLSTFVDEDLPQHPCRDVVYYSKSIFFDLRKPEDADIFVDSGFKMVCADQDHDSSLDRALFNRPDPLIGSISLNYAIWLFDHQAPLWKWSYRFTSPMPSIFVLADILSMQDYECPCQDNTKDRVEIYLSESVLVDDCSCLCSPDGCTPFTSRMRWLAHPYEQAQDLNPRDYATRFGSYVEIYGKRLNLSHHVIMVRQATFAALDLKHTCLERPGYRWPSRFHWMYLTDPVSELDPDEKEFEILNVDAEAINQLEDMVVIDSFDIDYSAFNEPSTLGIDNLYYQRALEFWKHIWANRMQIALDTVAKGWDNNLAGLNDLVHISTCEEVVQETRDSLDEGDDEILNRIIQRIQDI
ncbi:uncharacterized protein FOBCDRAFT_244566 [Fusarium oxysporum Fo47]|uniref:uncharacterized protein n=1 Tax=Fusarium oxysporum Fo47 TaxID=660027 RepID=UPI0028698520|nr:uncharacterized protein FOBCDRAFT_244566 [Fusarium oxysporum Fo47]QKD60982.2 hypothetical protein FOBCDRAFT_244566 [Fusarium oxysporum Fo47]